MSENYIHIDNISEDRATRPGEIGLGAYVNMRLDGVSQFALFSILSSLLTDLEIDPQDIAKYRRIVSEDVVRSDRAVVIDKLPEALERLRREKAEGEE